jgi:hypothetical protein
MPFLLSSENRPNGTVHLTYDTGPAERVNILAPMINAHETVMVPPEQLLAHTLSTVRPPAGRRKGTA